MITEPGYFVWAKWSRMWWPAITIRPSDCGKPSPKMGHSWVFWFYDHKISSIACGQMRSFTDCFTELFDTKSGKLLRKAVIEILNVLNSLMENPILSNEDDLIQWANQGFPHLQVKAVENLPPLVLKNLRYQMEVGSEYEASDDEGESLKEQLQSGKLNIRDICISCNVKSRPVVAEHPFFVGGICSSCKDNMKETVFAVGNDGKNICCIICTEAGFLVMCDNSNCSKSYCKRCLKHYLGSEETERILQAAQWDCFFCPLSENNSSILQVQEDWERRVFSLFDTGPIIKPENAENGEILLEGSTDKRPMTVLSLFDGIGTGKLVLDSLGIVVEKYYASEIDPDAINISKFHHNDSIIHLGDIRNITEDGIKCLGKIDLVIGGSPCNDLSLVNPNRKGIYDNSGTGCLFFDFFYVLSVVRRYNRKVFYLYENVASMRLQDKRIISSFLSQEPALIDAKYFTAASRPRFFWGNIPGLHSLADFWRSPDTNALNENLLSECIMPIEGRRAVVEKIRTVTTNRNSLTQGVVLPVEMGTEPDLLWVTELEKVFGFPLHYTDTGNISIGKRRELLGRSWSVPVIQRILKPLSHFFAKVDDPRFIFL